VGHDFSERLIALVAIYPTPIADNALDLAPHPPEFARTFHQTVGTAGTDADGFRVVVAPIFQHIADGPRFLRGFDSDLAAIGPMHAELDGRFHQDFAASIAATIKAGQPDFDAFAVHLTGKNAPGGQPVGPPKAGGGGLQPVAFGTLPQGAPPKFVKVPFTNPQNHVIHPIGIKVEQGRLGVFVATDDCGGSIPANGTCHITIEFRPLLAGHYTGLLVFTTDDPDSPYTISLSGVVLPRAAGGSGGGGIGPGVANDPFGFGGPSGSGFGGREFK
jgi:hypothetical protein